MVEFLLGSLRLGIPLASVTLGALCFKRVGIDNVAADGMILVGAVCYAALTGVTPPAIALAVSAAVVAGVALLMVLAIDGWRLNDILFTLGLYYVLGGVSATVCWARFNSPGYGRLSGDRLSTAVVLVVLATLASMIALLFQHVRAFRAARILGVSSRLAELDAIDARTWRRVHGVIGGLVLGLSGGALTEMGGAYTPGITNSRGFVALLIVSLTWPKRAIASVILAVCLLAVSQKAVTDSGNLTWLVEMLPLVGIFISTVAVRRHSTGWPRGLGRENEMVDVG